MAELGQHPAFQPSQQGACLGVERGDGGGIARHGVLHGGPIGHRGMDIAERRLERLEQFAPLAGVDARGLDIDQRFADPALAEAGDHAVRITLDRHHRVQQAVDPHALRSDGRGERIHEEGLVIVDDGDAQMTPRAAGRFELKDGLARLAHGSRREQPGRGFIEHRLVRARIAGQQRGFQLQAQGLDQRLRRRGGGGFRPHAWLLSILRPALAFTATLLCRIVFIVSCPIPLFRGHAQAG